MMIVTATEGHALDMTRERAYLWDFHRARRGSRIVIAAGVCSQEDSVRVGSFGNHPSYAPLVDALERLEFEVLTVDPSNPPALAQLTPDDLVFIHMHGEFGEDGRLQGLLDYRGIRYIGSGVLASAVGLDKVMFKRVLRGSGLPTPDYYTLEDGASLDAQLADAVSTVPGPWIVKPVGGGSSIAMQVAQSRAELSYACQLAQRDWPRRVFIEHFVEGTMVTVGLLELPGGLTVFPVVKPHFSRRFHDLETKLGTAPSTELSGREVPANLPEELALAVQATSAEVHRLLGCTGFSRVDMMIDSDSDLHLLEINTIPGIGLSQSFVAGAVSLGLSYDELLLAILRAAMTRPLTLEPS
jgi:D-alanine-D-alanine ligase